MSAGSVNLWDPRPDARYSPWRLAPEAWRLEPGASSLAPQAWRLKPGASSLAPEAWRLKPGA
jgi:hypothetical protein